MYIEYNNVHFLIFKHTLLSTSSGLVLLTHSSARSLLPLVLPRPALAPFPFPFPPFPVFPLDPLPLPAWSLMSWILCASGSTPTGSLAALPLCKLDGPVALESFLCTARPLDPTSDSPRSTLNPLAIVLPSGVTPRPLAPVSGDTPRPPDMGFCCATRVGTAATRVGMAAAAS